MFSGSFTNKDAFKSEGFSFFNSDGLRVAFYGRLYNMPDDPDAADPAKAVAMRYLKGGNSVFALLDGSFVIILWTGGKTLIVRDHHGTGPQVYYTASGFSSSLAELNRTGCCGTVDTTSLGLFLNTGYIPTGRSAFKNVSKLGAGSLLVSDGKGVEATDLFDVSGIWPKAATLGIDGKLDEYAARYAELHAQAIGKRIGGSRNVGILLSGGYDSGCNLAALRGIYDGEIKSFSIGFRGDNWSELPLAQCMSETFGTTHHTYEIDGSEIMSLPGIVAHLGDPFVEGGLMVNYAAMELAAKDRPDVILGGDGSDQYFGTSAREVALHYLTKHYGIQPLLKLAYGILDTKTAEKSNKAYRLKFYLDKILNVLHGDVFGIEQGRLKDYFRDPSQLAMPSRERSQAGTFESLYAQHAYVTDIDKVINQVILFKASRMAEMFGNTVAFPYLDTELYDFMQELPIGYKCLAESPVQVAKGNFTSKYLLKYKYKASLPEVITARKKQGGFAPMPVFFEDKNRRALLVDFIMQSSVVKDFLRRDTVERFIGNYEQNCTDNGRWFWYRQNQAIQFFNLLTLAVWWEMYVAGNADVRF